VLQIIKNPEFYMYHADIDLCSRYDLSLKLVRLAIILSILYNIYLPYVLFGSTLLPTILMGISSTLLYNINFSNDGETLHILEIILCSIGFVMLVIHAFLSANPNLNNHLENRRAG
jgi:hypothetical protein